MLSGQGVVAIWNGIAEEGRSEFYQWHLHEHMPERVGIPGFRRGRRYRAVDKNTHPEFFTLYEVDAFEVLQAQDYANRLNAPTPWTKRATAHFKDTSRGLARVLASSGPGSGGALATVRFGVSEAHAQNTRAGLIRLVPELVTLSQITGVHLCWADDQASGTKTTESRDRTDIQSPPNWFALIEACTSEALDEPVRRVTASSGIERAQVGRYAHEYTRLKTDWAAG
jgi:hypothetical protein